MNCRSHKISDIQFGGHISTISNAYQFYSVNDMTELNYFLPELFSKEISPKFKMQNLIEEKFSHFAVKSMFIL